MPEAMLRLIRERFHPMHRLRGSPIFRWLQTRCDFPVVVRVHGTAASVLFLRDLPAVLAKAGDEPEVERAIRLVAPLLQPRQFFDVGANLGFYAWLLRSLSPQCNLTLFEPDPQNAGLLKRTIQRNKMDRVNLIEAALSDRPGTIDFLRDHVSGKAGGVVDTRANAASIQAFYQLHATIPVRAVTLDDFAGDRPCPTLLKIDAEGAEKLILRGAENFVQLLRPVIVVEAFESAWLEQWCSTRNYISTALDPHGNYLLVPREQFALVELSEMLRWKNAKK